MMLLSKVSFGLGVAVAALSLSALSFAAEPARLGSGPGNGPTTESAAENDRQRVVSPYWERSSTGDMPAADIRAVPPARAAAVQARWIHLQLSTDLNIATRMVVMELEAKPEYRQAVTEEAAAYDAMQSARARALSPLQDNAAYTAAESLRSSLTVQIRDLHDTAKPDIDRIAGMARTKLAYIADNRKLEADALARDSGYQDARSKYVAAATRVSEQRQAVTMTIATDDGLQSLRRQVAEAKIAKLVSAAYLSSSVRARNIALDYAAYDRGIDRYHPRYAGWSELGGYYPSNSRYGCR